MTTASPARDGVRRSTPSATPSARSCWDTSTVASQSFRASRSSRTKSGRRRSTALLKDQPWTVWSVTGTRASRAASGARKRAFADRAWTRCGRSRRSSVTSVARARRVRRGSELTDQAGQRMMGHAARRDLRVVVPLPSGRGAEDEVKVDGGEAPIVPGRQKRDLLRAPDDHAGDHVHDPHRHPEASSLPSTRGRQRRRQETIRHAWRQVPGRAHRAGPRVRARRIAAAAIDRARPGPYHEARSQDGERSSMVRALDCGSRG